MFTNCSAARFSRDKPFRLFQSFQNQIPFGFGDRLQLRLHPAGLRPREKIVRVRDFELADPLRHGAGEGAFMTEQWERIDYTFAVSVGNDYLFERTRVFRHLTKSANESAHIFRITCPR
jgi:hypothetical protein